MVNLLRHPVYLSLELAVLALGVPVAMIYFNLASQLFTFLWAAAGYCLLIYILINGNDWRKIWGWQEVTWVNLRPILGRWMLVSAALLLFTWQVFPDKLFFILHHKPEILPFILVFYPIFSALPQEFIFCSYFFKRYEKFFGRGVLIIAASAVVFSFAHLMFINWVAPILSLLGGVIFARTFKQTGSLALVTIEHALYGNLLFTIGLGWFFWGGALG